MIRAFNLSLIIIFFSPYVFSKEISPTIAGNFNAGNISLYIECYGDGLPNIIVNSGFGGAGSDGSWKAVATEISKNNRICLYDRANLGNSEKTEGEYNVGDIANQLNSLLSAAAIKPPYIMVGHSYGSFPIKIFNDLFPNKVGAILLVDPSLYGMFYGNIAKWKPEEESYSKVNIDRMEAELAGWSNPQLNPEKIDMKSSAKLIKESSDFGNKPYILLWAKNAIWEGGDAPNDWHPNAWNRMKNLYAGDLAKMQTLSTDTKIVFANTPEHNVFIHEPKAVVIEINNLIEKLRSN